MAGTALLTALDKMQITESHFCASARRYTTKELTWTS